MRDPGRKEDRDEQDPTDQDDHVHETPPNSSPGRLTLPGACVSGRRLSTPVRRYRHAARVS
jgi:hypothetical protein